MGALRGVHYARHLKNKDLPEQAPVGVNGWTQLDPKQSRYHRLRWGKDNIKFVHKSGREAIYNSNGLVRSSLNGGTYNFFNPKGLVGNVGHFIADMVPYYKFRNSMSDPSFIYERLSGFSLGY